MSKRKTAAVKAWETALQTEGTQKQLDAAKRLLRQSWVVPMPVLPSNPWVEPVGRWCEAIVLAVYWTTGPGTPVNKVVLAIPEGAAENTEDTCEVVANLYLPGAGPDAAESTEETIVHVVVMPGAYLVRKLSEAVPREEPLVTFSEAYPSALPTVGQVFPLWPIGEEFMKGMLVSLEEAQGEEELRITYGEEPLLEEVYHSTAEMDFGELQEALLPVAAAAAPKKRASPTDRTGNPFTGAPGGRRAARVVAGMSEIAAAPRPKAKAAARRESGATASPAQPAGMAELLAAVQLLTDKVAGISGASVEPTTSAGPKTQSLLDAGRVPPPGMTASAASLARHGGLGLRGETAGDSAYGRTLAAARQMLGEVAESHAAADQRGVARGRAGEEVWREQMMQGGLEGMQATQLAILETLERMQEQQERPIHSFQARHLRRYPGGARQCRRSRSEWRGRHRCWKRSRSKRPRGIDQVAGSPQQASRPLFHAGRSASLACAGIGRFRHPLEHGSIWTTPVEVRKIGNAPALMGHSLLSACAGSTRGLGTIGYAHHPMFEGYRAVCPTRRKLEGCLVAHGHRRLSRKCTWQHGIGPPCR
eukprot:1851637-Amphidinium_carterae.2